MENIKETAEYKDGFEKGCTLGYSYGLSGMGSLQNFFEKSKKELDAARDTPDYAYVLGVSEGFPVGYKGD